MATLRTKQLSLFFFLFIVFTSSAQIERFNRWSIEFSTGIHVPFAPSNYISRSKYIAFNQIQLSGRYMFTDKFGLKGHYAFNKFVNPKNSNNNISLNRLGLEGVANITKLLNVGYTIREHVGLLAHAGGGITFAQPSSSNGTDHIGNLMFGLTGQIKLSKNFTLLGDMTYVANFSQQYAFNGRLINSNYDPVSGGIINVSIGVMYSFGRQSYHADWH